MKANNATGLKGGPGTRLNWARVQSCSPSIHQHWISSFILLLVLVTCIDLCLKFKLYGATLSLFLNRSLFKKPIWPFGSLFLREKIRQTQTIFGRAWFVYLLAISLKRKELWGCEIHWFQNDRIFGARVSTLPTICSNAIIIIRFIIISHHHHHCPHHGDDNFFDIVHPPLKGLQGPSSTNAAWFFYWMNVWHW